jgi:hypothetical protein
MTTNEVSDQRSFLPSRNERSKTGEDDDENSIEDDNSDADKNSSAGGQGADDANADPPKAVLDLVTPLIQNFIHFLSHACFCCCLLFRGNTANTIVKSNCHMAGGLLILGVVCYI